MTKRGADSGAKRVIGVGRLRLRRGLYRVGGAAALIAALLFRRNLAAEFVLLRELGVIGSGPMAVPASAGEWFTLLDGNRLIGLTLFNVFDLVNYALLGVIFLTLHVALRRAGRRVMAIAIILGLTGIAVAIASNRAFAMLSLSERYAVAATEAERAILLARGEALLAVDNPGAAYQSTGATLSLFLVTVAAVVISVVMVRSSVFGRATGYVGLVAEMIQLGYFVALAFALPPALLAIPPSTAAPFRLVWYVLMGRRLLRLGTRTREGRRKDCLCETIVCAIPGHALDSRPRRRLCCGRGGDGVSDG